MTDPQFVDAEIPFEELLTQARAGSSAAFGMALSLCAQELQRQASAHFGPDELHSKIDELDLVQMTYLKAQRNFARFHGTTQQEFLAWLHRILTRNIQDLHARFLGTKKRQVQREVSLDDENVGPVLKNLLITDPPPPDAQLLAEEKRAAIQSGLQSLPESYARVIELHTLQGLPFGEVGGQLHCSADAARKLHSRAVNRLRDALGGLE
jgi:RNA polymerase sigma-70 factor, ECF subfamily